MIKLTACVLLLWGALLVTLTAANNEQEVFLPPDCDVLKIVGNGFKLELSQFEAIKKDFKQVDEDSAKIKKSRESHDEANSNNSANGEKVDDEKPVINENLFEKTKSEEGDKDYGYVDNDLLRWISDRATSLMNRIERYNQELMGASGGNRIVLDILLLNTLVDLDNLIKEEIVSLRWVKNKLYKLETNDVHREAKASEVEGYVKSLILNNKLIESKVQGRNDPGKAWATNTQAIKRVLHEQRFSKALGELVVEFLAGQFNMMKRSIVYDINRQPEQLDDGLYYLGSRGRVPADFPFSAQDAISHGAYN